MRVTKTILIFSDLEGTILKEENGQYDEEEMQQFLAQIDKMQQMTDAEVRIHLVSPVYKEQMKKVMDDIDKSILRYNVKNRPKEKIEYLEGAAAYPETDMLETEYSNTYLKDTRIAELKKPISMSQFEFDLATHGKLNYVRSWYDDYNERENKDLLLAIYMGNGRNDIEAMRFLSSKKQGVIICPSNSRRQIKASAFNVGTKEDLPGLTEGIAKINDRISIRSKKSEEKGSSLDIKKIEEETELDER